MILSVVGCKNKNADNSDGQDYFNGIVTEMNENSFLVKPVEGEAILNSADLISVPMKLDSNESLPDIKVGDEVRIAYDGKVAESYPAQLITVYGISVIKELQED